MDSHEECATGIWYDNPQRRPIQVMIAPRGVASDAGAGRGRRGLESMDVELVGALKPRCSILALLACFCRLQIIVVEDGDDVVEALNLVGWGLFIGKRSSFVSP